MGIQLIAADWYAPGSRLYHRGPNQGKRKLDGSGHYLRGRKSALGLLGHSIHPPTDPESTHVSPAFQPLPVQPRPANDHFPPPANLLVAFLDQQDTGTLGLINEMVTNLFVSCIYRRQRKREIQQIWRARYVNCRSATNRTSNPEPELFGRN